MNGERNLWTARLATDLRAALAIVAALAVVPVFVSSPYWLGILVVSIYFALLALGWNLLAGFTGQFSLAPAAFAMIGAYVTGLLDYHLKAPLWIGIPAAIVGTALLGWILGRVVLRLKGPYLALTTLSFAEIARVVIGN
jgi:branched-chain amino acid transport system permease protein